MFWVSVMRGDKMISKRAVSTLAELAVMARSEFKSTRSDLFLVAVGASAQAIIPYAWISRDERTDEWIGLSGDSIRLGLKQNEIQERPEMEIMMMDEDTGRSGPVLTIEKRAQLLAAKLLRDARRS